MTSHFNWDFKKKVFKGVRHSYFSVIRCEVYAYLSKIPLNCLALKLNVYYPNFCVDIIIHEGILSLLPVSWSSLLQLNMSFILS